MKKIVILFFLILNFSAFAIPDFEALKWGDSLSNIKKYYPSIKKSFVPGENVTRYTFSPLNDEQKIIIFYLFEDKLYKIISEFNTEKIEINDVKKVFQKYVDKWGSPTPDILSEKYRDFYITGNKQTWILKNTYISFIGKDTYDNDDNLTNSELLMEYGLIDPAKRDEMEKNKANLNNLILNN
jgi:predicted transcriptional regulator